MSDFNVEAGSSGYNCSLLGALKNRRSRRFLHGMTMPEGALNFQSTTIPTPLTEEEEAILVFAASGITGFALGELQYEEGGGGSIMSNFVGRTTPSGDAANSVSLVVTNDSATYWIKRPWDFTPDEIRELIDLSKRDRYVEIYRKMRVEILDRRAAPTLEPPKNLDVNRWSLYAKGSTYLLPVQELTFLYINAALEVMGESMGYFILDERNKFKPAGIARFGRSKGGHLYDSMADGRVGTVQGIEATVSDFIATEQGMVMQNIALTAHALGLGGFPHWAAHPFAWFQELGFKCQEMPVTRYLGMSQTMTKLAGAMGKRDTIPVPVALEKDGKTLLKLQSPPNFSSMAEAVNAVVECQYGKEGTYSGLLGGWKSNKDVLSPAKAPSKATIEAVTAYCDYILQRYGRFPAYPNGLKTTLGFQAGRVEDAFYEKYYTPESVARG